MGKTQGESVLQKQIEQYLMLKGVYCWRQKNGGTFDPKTRRFRANTTRKGISDILGIYCGKLVAIEVKMPGSNRVTPEQKLFLSEIKARGGLSGIAHSIEEAHEIIFGNQVAKY